MPRNMPRNWAKGTRDFAGDGRKVVEGRQNQLKELNGRHHSILRLSLLGYSRWDIAEKLQCSYATVCSALDSNLGKAQKGILQSELDGTAVEAAKRIREIAPKAIKVVEEILESENVPTAVKLKAAQDVLDRAGMGAVKRVDVASSSVSISLSDIEEMKRTAMERAKANGLLIDVSPTSCDTVASSALPACVGSEG